MYKRDEWQIALAVKKCQWSNISLSKRQGVNFNRPPPWSVFMASQITKRRVQAKGGCAIWMAVVTLHQHRFILCLEWYMIN